MKEKFEDGSGFANFLTKRNSKKSTVGIVETSDKLRKQEYIGRFEGLLVDQKKQDICNTKRNGYPIRLYLVDLFTGINEVFINIEGNNEIVIKSDEDIKELDRLKIDVQTKPYNKDDIGLGSNSIMPFEVSLPIVSNLLKDLNFTTIVIISGLINEQRTLNTLEMFVDDIAINGNMFKTQSLVAIITSDAGLLPQSIRSNTFLIRPKPSTKDERERIMEEVIEHYKNTFKKKNGEQKKAPTLLDKKLDYYIDITDGLNLDDFQSSLLESLIRNDYKRILFDDIVKLKTQIVNALKGVRIDTLEKARGFDAVGGYAPIKDWLRRKIVLVYENFGLAKTMNVNTPRGVLLFGPPGTGKTWLSKQLAKDLDCVFLEIMFEQLMSKWVGESEGNLNDLLNRIDAMGDKVVVFIDEMDSMGKRGDGGTANRVHDAMFSRFLKWLSDPNRKCTVFGATNRPELLDPAIIRDQRFDKIIYMGLPDLQARKEIFLIKFQETGVKLTKEVNIDSLAKRTAYYSGANIEGIVKEAQTIAFERIIKNNEKNHLITNEDVQKAMKVKSKNIDEIKKVDRAYITYAEGHCDDKSLVVTISPEETEKKIRDSRLDMEVG